EADDERPPRLARGPEPVCEANSSPSAEGGAANSHGWLRRPRVHYPYPRGLDTSALSAAWLTGSSAGSQLRDSAGFSPASRHYAVRSGTLPRPKPLVN